MKKLNFLEKLNKNELKQIKAGEGGTRNGGSNNGGTGGNDECGLEPEVCYSAQWYTWYNCKVAANGTQPYTQCN